MCELMAPLAQKGMSHFPRVQSELLAPFLLLQLGLRMGIDSAFGSDSFERGGPISRKEDPLGLSFTHLETIGGILVPHPWKVQCSLEKR
ncbi:hypothetical protein CEXT_701881 [Caerostris extrusa]|uniref:Uncharacterized protein n=1 Tax=Caerostris extrusa TaxID=172846 RepID=A0AAV4VKX8_CAEEX|nr:hypothetical protein CEXT_701881 [Caerostris extrusa]